MFISLGITIPIDRVVLRMSNSKTFATQKTPRMKWTDEKSADDTLMSSLPLVIENRLTRCEKRTQNVELVVARVTVDEAVHVTVEAVLVTVDEAAHVIGVRAVARVVDHHHEGRVVLEDDRDRLVTNDAASRPNAMSHLLRGPRANDLDLAIRNVTTDGKSRDPRLENRLLADLVLAEHDTDFERMFYTRCVIHLVYLKLL